MLTAKEIVAVVLAASMLIGPLSTPLYTKQRQPPPGVPPAPAADAPQQ